MRKLFSFKPQDDGIFYMEVKDFCEEFKETCCNFVHENYFYDWVQINLKKGSNYFFVKLTSNSKTNHGYLSISQIDHRASKVEKYQLFKMVVYR